MNQAASIGMVDRETVPSRFETVCQNPCRKHGFGMSFALPQAFAAVPVLAETTGFAQRREE
jgi:hypothetical protein